LVVGQVMCIKEMEADGLRSVQSTKDEKKCHRSETQ
jgi:hypothetical protein